MANIKVLDQSTINKIAAGEVIERPASVVKELVENAIDAKATAITVEIKDGGISFIRITDNGMGIGKDDVKTAFLPHATSKISNIEDLFTVTSLGFRGEALASIAAVSQVELITKTMSSMTGVRYEIDGGIDKSYEEIGAPEGTTFIIRNLFFNTPARRNFLKSAKTEASYIADLVERMALSNPQISFVFITNNQNKLHTSGNCNLKDIIYNIYGREIATNLLEVKKESDIINIEGFIGKPIIARGNRSYENYFINGRYIKNSLISRAIEEAYRPYMMLHKYPYTALHLTVDPEIIDVNVHPTKMELRFRNGQNIYDVIYNALSDALSHKELIPDVTLVKREEEKKDSKRAPEPFEVNRNKNSNFLDNEKKKEPISYKPLAGNVYTPGVSTVRESPEYRMPPERKPILSYENKPKMQDVFEKRIEGSANSNIDVQQSKESVEVESDYKKIPVTSKAEQLDLFEEKLLEKKAKREHKIIGQVFDTYYIVQYKENMFIIDQHAAHEKVLYERTMKTLKNREYTSQQVNPPIIMTLSMHEEEMLLKYMPYFEKIGFEIEHFGGKEYAIRAIPDNLFGIAKKDLFIELIDSLSDDTGITNPEIITDRVATMSCKAAVKGNNRLSVAEFDNLIDELMELDNPYACPHGRPTIISMSKYEIDKKFKRIL